MHYKTKKSSGTIRETDGASAHVGRHLCSAHSDVITPVVLLEFERVEDVFGLNLKISHEYQSSRFGD